MKKIIFYVTSIVTGIILFSTNSCKEKDNATSDEITIRTMYKEFSEAVASKDINKIMSFYAPGDELVAFDAFLPRQYKGATAYRKDYEGFFSSFPGPAKSVITDLNIKVSGNLAYTNCIDQWIITGADSKPVDMVMRATDVMEKRNDKWLIIHEHISFPVDPVSGKADYLSKP